MKKHRIFDRFGFNVEKPARSKQNTAQRLDEYKDWNFDSKQNNWIDPETEQLLSDDTPPPELMALLDYNINTQLE